MRRNLLVKVEGTLLGRPACVKIQKIMVYSSTAFRMSRKVRCQEQRKESAQMMKGCLGDSWEGGSSGEIQSGLDAHFVTLSLSISMKRKVIACSGGCKALMDSRISLILGPRRLANNIQKLISATPRGSEVKGHAPGSLPVSTHKKDLQGQPLSLSL